jgi:hypothetical protein
MGACALGSRAFQAIELLDAGRGKILFKSEGISGEIAPRNRLSAPQTSAFRHSQAFGSRLRGAMYLRLDLSVSHWT